MAKEELIPAIVQDHKTGEVLMLAYMNQESLKLTKETGYTWFFSRSRQKLWNKGETSGNKQAVKELRYDCDEDTFLVLVEQIGDAACHTGNRSCFYRQMVPDEVDVGDKPPIFEDQKKNTLDELFDVIEERKTSMPAGSYSADLFRAGREKILAKVAEESGEVAQAARKESDTRLVEESADLIYHLMVLLADRGVSFDMVEDELKRRRR